MNISDGEDGFSGEHGMLMTREQVVAKIQSGVALSLAGDETVLAGLPRGNWIGGSIPYFMAEQGGVNTREQIFVQEFTEGVLAAKVRHYPASQLPKIPHDSPDNGYSILIIPAMSAVHVRYAQDAPSYEGLFMKQIVGWIAGIDLNDIGKVQPKVFDGVSGGEFTDEVVVLHVDLKPECMAQIGIINLFEQGDGDVFEFSEEGFQVRDCLVNGTPRNLAEYLVKHQVDTRLPLVADYNGEMINVSFQKVDAEAGTVDLYAPIFCHVKYRIAAPLGEYAAEFRKRALEHQQAPTFACNCILNYVYGELEGKQTGVFQGPITFGEVAYQLLNQTLVYLTIDRSGL